MTEKLQKVLANLGLGSRREMERWIEQGRVEVNGTLAKLGDRVDARAKIAVDHQLIERLPKARTRVIMYHKPIGQICSRVDTQDKETVFDALPKLKQGRWIGIGRLDVNTSGLLLFTNDGELANRLMHPRSGIEREYTARVLGEADTLVMERLTQGVQLEDGLARFEHIVEGRHQGVNHWYYVVVTEGRNRVVRRLFESQNLKVNRLKRVRFGPIMMDSRLRQGQWRDLTPDWISRLRDCVGDGS